jgi:hypothetical protein
MGVGSQPHSPPELVRISPPRPTDPWTRANTAQPTCRLRVRGPGTAQRCTRMPRACGSQDATPAPLLDAHSGTRAMARGAVSADPRGSCHQPRRYHVSPATHGSAGLLPQKTRHAVTQRASASLCTKYTRFDIIAVLYTCTTVASRVATNACATHLRFLTQPQTSFGLASSRSPGVVKT